MCLRVLKESNKSRFDSYSRQKQCIDHIPHYLSGLSVHIFSDNLSRNNCIMQRQQVQQDVIRLFSKLWLTFFRPSKGAEGVCTGFEFLN